MGAHISISQLTHIKSWTQFEKPGIGCASSNRNSNNLRRIVQGYKARFFCFVMFPWCNFTIHNTSKNILSSSYSYQFLLFEVDANVSHLLEAPQTVDNYMPHGHSTESGSLGLLKPWIWIKVTCCLVRGTCRACANLDVAVCISTTVGLMKLQEWGQGGS